MVSSAVAENIPKGLGFVFTCGIGLLIGSCGGVFGFVINELGVCDVWGVMDS